MRRRLRKTLRRGEFVERGFPVGFRFLASAAGDATFDLLDEFLREAIDPYGLAFTGGGREDWTGVVTTFGRGSVTESQRAGVLAWLESHAKVTAVRAGPLVDVWRSPPEGMEPPSA